MERFLVRRALPADAAELAGLRIDLWPEPPLSEHLRELAAVLEDGGSGALPSVIFVAADLSGRLIGFLEAGLRSHAEGCDSSRPAGYVEGWYVAPEHRRRGVGARLMAAAESWAREQGCVEMASDTWLENVDSQRAHESLGFEETDRCVHYRKSMSG